MDESLVEVGDAREPPHRLAVHLGKEHQFGVNDIAKRPQHGLQDVAPPADVIAQVGQGDVEQPVHAVNLVVPAVQISPTNGDPSPLAHPFRQAEEPSRRGRVQIQVNGEGQIVRPRRFAAIPLQEGLVVRRRVPAEQHRRTVPSLDQHAVAVFVVQVEGPKEGIETPLLRPRSHGVQQRFGNLVLLQTLEEAE